MFSGQNSYAPSGEADGDFYHPISGRLSRTEPLRHEGGFLPLAALEKFRAAPRLKSMETVSIRTNRDAATDRNPCHARGWFEMINLNGNEFLVQINHYRTVSVCPSSLTYSAVPLTCHLQPTA